MMIHGQRHPQAGFRVDRIRVRTHRALFDFLRQQWKKQPIVVIWHGFPGFKNSRSVVPRLPYRVPRNSLRLRLDS